MNEELVQNGVMNEELIQNGVMNEELVQNVVMNEELVQNGVMGAKFVKNFVMGAKIDLQVVMDLSIFNIGGWNSLLQATNQNLMEKFMVENEAWLLIGIPSRDPFLVTQYYERLCEFRSAHEEVDVTSRRSSCDGATLHATLIVIGYMNIQEDMHRGENLR